MSNLVIRQEKTLDGLRDRLYGTLDAIIADKIPTKNVDCICAISEQIINSAKLEIDTMLRIKADNEKTNIAAQERLTEVIESIPTLDTSCHIED